MVIFTENCGFGSNENASYVSSVQGTRAVGSRLRHLHTTRKQIAMGKRLRELALSEKELPFGGDDE